MLCLHRLEDQIDVSEKLFDTYPILIYPCKIYDTGLGQLRAPKQGILSIIEMNIAEVARYINKT